MDTNCLVFKMNTFTITRKVSLMSIRINFETFELGTVKVFAKIAGVLPVWGNTQLWNNKRMLFVWN